MSINETNPVYQIIVQQLLFLELSSDEEIDPDIAVEQMEEIFYLIHQFDSKQRLELKNQINIMLNSKEDSFNKEREKTLMHFLNELAEVTT